MPSSDAPVDIAPSSEAPVNTEGEAAGLSVELERAKARNAGLESVKTMTAWWHKMLIHESKQHQAEETSVWKRIS